MNHSRHIVKLASFRWIVVTVLFFLVTWAYMGPSMTHINTVVLSKPGDHTAGIMYASWVHPSSPVLGHSNLTNYPYGENLHQPLSSSAIIPLTGHLILSRVTNTVCAWNLMVLIGYMSSALIMFGFIRWLTRSSWVAFFAGYAVAFAPYHVFASWGQLAGLLGAIFVLALWQFIDMWRKPTWWKGVRLGGIIGLGFYTDGYFILFGAVMLLAFWLASLSYGFLVERGLKGLKYQLKCLVAASMVSIVALLPLGWIKLRYSSQINSFLGNTRGDIAADAQTYSAQLHMYLNPQSLLFLGFSVIILAAIGLVFMWAEYRASRERGVKNIEANLFAGWVSFVLGLIAAWISLRPKASFFGTSFYNPSGLIIALTSSWRVFGRLYMLVVVGVVTVAALGLSWLVNKYPTRRYIIVGAAVLALVVEFGLFYPSSPAKNFDYRHAPPVYGWLKDNPAIQAVAEYPLDEPPQGAYLGDYYTFQQISGKPILNTFLPNSPQSELRRSIAGINDPQTLPVLRALGVGVVNVRPVNINSRLFDMDTAASVNPGLRKIFSYGKNSSKISSYAVEPGPAASYALVLVAVQYFQVSLNDNGSASYGVGDNTSMALVKLPNASEKESVAVEFDVISDIDRKAAIVQDGALLWSGVLGTQTQTIRLEVSPDHPFIIHNQTSPQLTRMIISRMQVTGE